MTQQDKDLFEATYCGMCHTLGRRYGLAGRMILNYDLTFLAMLLEKEACPQACRRCIAHPLRRRPCVCGSSAMDTAADISVILAWWKLQDDIEDNGFFSGLLCRMAALCLRRAYGRARERQKAFNSTTQAQLAALAQLEEEKEPSLDRPADTFACLLCSAAEVEGDPVRRRVLREMLYHLGRWIYLVDAADDLKKDAEAGNYNPLPLRYGFSGGEICPEVRQQLGLTLDSSVRAMAAAFELADFGAYRSLIENVVYAGLYQVAGAVLNGTFRKSKRKK